MRFVGGGDTPRFGHAFFFKSQLVTSEHVASFVVKFSDSMSRGLPYYANMGIQNEDLVLLVMFYGDFCLWVLP